MVTFQESSFSITTFSSNIAGAERYEVDSKLIPNRLRSGTTPPTREFVTKAIETLRNNQCGEALRLLRSLCVSIGEGIPVDKLMSFDPDAAYMHILHDWS